MLARAYAKRFSQARAHQMRLVVKLAAVSGWRSTIVILFLVASVGLAWNGKEITASVLGGRRAGGDCDLIPQNENLPVVTPPSKKPG